MITVKKRLLAALLLSVLLLFTACQTPATDPSFSLGNDAPNDTVHTPLAEQMYVILPANAGGTLVDRAEELTEALKEKTGIDTTLRYDDSPLPFRDDSAFILLGYTDLEPSREAISPLKRDDYLCRWDGEMRTLLLGGKSDAATIAAIDRFTETLLPYADASLLMSADQAFLVSAAYPISEVTLNGHSLGSYVISCPKTPKAETVKIATALREALSDRCGFYLDIVYETPKADAERRIRLSESPSEDGKSHILSDGTRITVIAQSMYDRAEAAACLVSLIVPSDATDTVTLTLPDSTEVSLSQTDLALLPSRLPNGFASTSDTLSTLYDAVNAVKESDVALVPTDALSTSTYEALTNSLTGYEILGKEDSIALSPLLCYRPDVLMLREQKTLLSSADVVLQAYRFTLTDASFSFTLYHICLINEAGGDPLLSELNRALRSSDEPALLMAYLPNGTIQSLGKSNPFDCYTHTLSAAREFAIAYEAADAFSVLRCLDKVTIRYGLFPTHPFLTAN